MWLNLKLNRSRCGPRDEQGVVLLLVLLILALISVLVLSWAQEWRTELRLAANFREASQCRRLAEGGVYYALGKLIETKSLEATLATPRASYETLALLADSWKGSQESHQIKLPGGIVEVRVEDEGGKVNINQASETELATLFSALEFPRGQIPTMVDSVLDWRSRGDQPRLNGAKSSYYLGLDPPYVARNGPLEAVEELGWVRGFENSPMLPRLSEWLTVMPIRQGVNVNTAPLAVLLTKGIPPEVARNIITTRQLQPFRNFQDITKLGVPAQPSQIQQMVFLTSPFFTIKSTGMVNKQGGRQTIKAIVRVDPSARSPWQILSWVDDFPG
ncbi:MAG: type II secretion system minor pseudopilin GspK [Deltaproteobacteria bacterium]|nr:type II secretion system minor pseudopilin GspK [Deltaproteobacteria bacterium]